MFGGNFLHSFGILKQLKCAKVEDTTKVPQKFRYPFFTEMLWYVLAKYVHTLLGCSHLEGEPSREEELDGQPHVHLTHYELFGLKEIVMFLYDLPSQRKNVPELIKDPVQLIKDVRILVERHCKDSRELAVTGIPVLHPDLNRSNNQVLNERLQSGDFKAKNSSHDDEDGDTNKSASVAAVDETGNNDGHVSDESETKNSFQTPKTVIASNKSTTKASTKKNASNNDGTNGNERSNGNASAPRRRRRRCKVCVPCNSTECGHCAFCLDMVSGICLLTYVIYVKLNENLLIEMKRCYL